MTNRLNLPLDNALAVYTAALPRQARLISLAGQVLRSLAQVRASLPPPLEVDGEQAAARMAAGQPVLAEVTIPTAIFQNTLSRLLDLCREFELLPALAPEQHRSLLALPPHAWLTGTEALNTIWADSEAPAGLLFFLGRQTLAPFYQQAAEPFLTVFLQDGWKKATCPGCGQEPALACLTPDSGQRLLYCSLCAAQWRQDRQTCAFCGQSPVQFNYFFVEDDPARRADFCPACQRYLKTIVTARLTHQMFLPLEEYVTVSLDTLMARDDLLA